MAEHPNVDLIRRGYDLFEKGDMDGLRGIFTDDVVWHVPPGLPFSGDKKGVDAALQYFGELVGATDGTFKAETHTILADDEHAVGLHRDTAQRGGKSLDVNEILILHVRDGKIAEAWESYTDFEAYKSFFS